MAARKLAIFVEGQTESIFLERLLTEVVGDERIIVRRNKAKDMTLLDIRATTSGDEEFYVLLSDCAQDVTVKSRILENRTKLISAGYELILGLRDLHPHARTDLDQVVMHLTTKVPTKGIPIAICLSVMEIESWFLFDASHYEKIDNKLVRRLIQNATGFDPETDNPEDIDRPAELLRDIYRLVGKTYNKERKKVERTVDVLDYEFLYLKSRETLVHSAGILNHLDEFF